MLAILHQQNVSDKWQSRQRKAVSLPPYLATASLGTPDQLQGILRVTWSTQSSPFSCFGSRRGQQQYETVLQALSTGAAPTPSDVKGVDSLIREGRSSVAQLQQHSCGQPLLRPDVVSTVPQKGRLWLLLKVGCITCSSWHLFLGFHEESKPLSSQCCRSVQSSVYLM